MVKLCLYENTGTVLQQKTFFGTHSQGEINHFLLQMNVIVGGPFIQRKYLDSKVPSLALEKFVMTKVLKLSSS